jgi:T5SS/PEP-CTERM-associated repeat protein
MWWSTSHDVIRVGGEGVGNSLAIRDGGQVLDGYGDIGEKLFASNNSVLVTGSGSVWSNSGGMGVGGYGSGCSLVISNGGQVFGGGGDATTIGNVSSTNWVRVVDGGLWQNTTLTVGNQGSSNSVVIAGGSVSATNVVVGADSPTCNNVLELDSGTVTVTNNGSGVLEVRNGELVVNGGMLQADTLVITNPCAEFIHTGGTLIVSNLVLDPNTFRVVSVAQQSNDVLVTWMMGPGATNTLQASPGDGSGGYSTNGFTDMFIVTNNTIIGTITNYTDIGAATNKPSRYYRARMVP